MSESKDLFAPKSKSWDMNSKRVKNERSIDELIVKNIKLKPTMEVMDFGAGTGLLSFFVAQKVSKIVAVDNSPSMLEEFKKKSHEFASQTEVLELDLSVSSTDRKFDGIISSMTIHHLEDTKTLFSKFYEMLNEDGFIAIADLDTENGSFHSDNTGVFHYGFDREILGEIAEEVGFKNIQFETASIIEKPQCDFSVFLLTAQK
jgi:cyclopropane fatty-acyl-phospholipid synthase-like methyltransferase